MICLTRLLYLLVMHAREGILVFYMLYESCSGSFQKNKRIEFPYYYIRGPPVNISLSVFLNHELDDVRFIKYEHISFFSMQFQYRIDVHLFLCPHPRVCLC